MFVFTTKLSRIILVLAVIAVLAAALIIVPRVVPASAADALAAETNEQRVAYLEGLGLSVVSTPAEQQQVLIPEEFSAVYEEYNHLQQTAGFDLLPYAGREVTRYCYRIMDYEDCADVVYAELLVCDNRIIGGDIHSISLNGFMVPLG